MFRYGVEIKGYGKNMVMQNKLVICALDVLIKNQYASIIHTNKQLVNSENWFLK